MRYERASGRSDLKRDEDRGIYLDKSLAVQIFPCLCDYARTFDESILDLRIYYQIDISLAIAEIGIGETVELFR